MADFPTRSFIIRGPAQREAICQLASTAPEGISVVFKEPTRNLEQNAKFHAICTDVSKSGFKWAGKARTAAQWKVLFVSGHAIATKLGADMVPGLESEFVNLRESTAAMSKKRASSLIEYAIAFCVMNGIRLSDGVRT